MFVVWTLPISHSQFFAAKPNSRPSPLISSLHIIFGSHYVHKSCHHLFISWNPHALLRVEQSMFDIKPSSRRFKVPMILVHPPPRDIRLTMRHLSSALRGINQALRDMLSTMRQPRLTMLHLTRKMFPLTSALRDTHSSLRERTSAMFDPRVTMFQAISILRDSSSSMLDLNSVLRDLAPAMLDSQSRTHLPSSALRDRTWTLQLLAAS